MRILDFLRPSTIIPLFKRGVSVFLQGPPGCGKSSILHDVRQILSDHFETDFGMHVEYVTTLDAPDVRGFLVPAKDKDGKPISYFTRSGIVPSDDYLKKHPYGLQVLEERSQGPMIVQSSVAPGVLERRFGNVVLPKTWWVISTGNRMEDRSGVVRPPMHLINRETVIEIDFDITSASVYWERVGMHPMGIAFAKSNPGVFVDSVPKDPKPYCTPRSFEAAMTYVSMAAGKMPDGTPNMNLPSDPVIQSVVCGDVGEGVAAQMFAYFKVADQLPTIEQIMRDPQGCKAPERLDAAYAAVQMCIHHADANNADKLWTYVERLPVDLQTSAAVSLIERQSGALLNSKKLNDWINKNRALIIATNAK